MPPPIIASPPLKTFPIEDRLRVCSELSDFALGELAGPLPSVHDGDRMVLAAWGRAAGTFSAVLLLAEQGYGDQVGMLARALFEGMVDAYWIAKHPAAAQRIGVLHFRHTRLRVAEHWNEHERRNGDPELPCFAEDIRERAELNALFGHQGQRHWTRQNLPGRIAEVNTLVPQDHDGELRARYDNDNGLANLLLHGGAVVLDDRITDTAFGNATIHAGASEQHLANGLRHGYWSYERFVRLVVGRHARQASGRVEDLFRTGWPLLQTITGPAVKAAGRNGSCPCGSQRKTKDCHGAL